MKIDLKGVVHHVGETQQISEKFKKRVLVVFVENTDKPEFSDYIPVDAVQDNVDKLDPLKVGDEVNVGIFLGGRKWEKDGTTKYFPDLKLANVEVLSSAPQSNDAVAPPEPGEEDDLPF